MNFIFFFFFCKLKKPQKTSIKMMAANNLDLPSLVPTFFGRFFEFPSIKDWLWMNSKNSTWGTVFKSQFAYLLSTLGWTMLHILNQLISVSSFLTATRLRKRCFSKALSRTKFHQNYVFSKEMSAILNSSQEASCKFGNLHLD